MLPDIVFSAARLPLLLRGDAMRPSSLTLLLVVSLPLLALLTLQVRAGMRLRTALLWAGLGLYASWAAGLLFEPRTRAVDTYAADAAWTWINLVPFATIAAQFQAGSGGALVQLVGNIGLLLPLGLIGPFVMPSLRRLPRLSLVALGASVVIELVQLVGTSTRLLDRSVDIDDVILNVAGALIGWVLWRAITFPRCTGRGRRNSASRGPDPVPQGKGSPSRRKSTVLRRCSR